MGMQYVDVLAKSEKLRKENIELKKENKVLKNEVDALETEVKSLRADLEKYVSKTNMTAPRKDTLYSIEELARAMNIMGEGLI